MKCKIVFCCYSQVVEHISEKANTIPELVRRIDVNIGSDFYDNSMGEVERDMLHQQKIDDFTRWCCEKGCTLNSIELKWSFLSGVGAYAKHDIKKGIFFYKIFESISKFQYRKQTVGCIKFLFFVVLNDVGDVLLEVPASLCISKDTLRIPQVLSDRSLDADEHIVSLVCTEPVRRSA